MFVGVESGDSGWGGYTLLVEGKPRKGATLIKGDIKLGDAICQSTDYKSGQYFRLVISFSPDEGVTPKKGREIAKEYIKEMMHGYREDEFHYDLVEHTDTERLHYHVRIAKLNLLTQTQLHYHYLSDIKRKDAIHQYLEIKHDLKSPFEEKKLLPDPSKRVEQINKWREDHGQQPFDLSNKKGRGEAEERIADYIQEIVTNGLVESLDEVQEELKGLGFQIAKVGHDNGKDFDYITIQDDTGKLRLRGDLYGERFYERNREDRAEAIRSGKSLDRRNGSDRPSLAEAKRTLDKANKQRNEFIESRFKTARERALSNTPTPPASDRSRTRDRGEDNKEQRGRNEKKSVRPKREPSRQNKEQGGNVDERVEAEIRQRARSLRAREKQSERAIRNTQRRLRKQHQNAIERVRAKDSRYDELRQQRVIERNELSSTFIKPTEEDYRAIEQAIGQRQHSQATTATLYRVLEWLNDRKSKITNSLNRGKRTAIQLNKWVRAVVDKGNQMQELNRFKQEINLAEYAQTFGYTIDKKKSTKISPVLKKDGDTLVIGQSRADNHYIYFNTNNDSDKGSVIDFVKNRTNESLGHIRKRLRTWLGMPNPQVERVQVQPAALDEIELQMSREKAQRAWENIDEQLLELYRGELRDIPSDTIQKSEDIKFDGNQWYFALRDQQGEICGIETRNNEGRNARVGEGHKKGIFAFGGTDRELCKKIIITESTIDALSAKYIAKDSRNYSHAFISIGGNAGKVAETALKELCDRLPNAEIILATDNDAGGERHAEKFKSIIGQDRKFTRYTPQRKDLNEDLVIIKAERMKQRQQKQQQVRGRKI